MRRLIAIPIVHASADLGSLAESARAHYARKYGPDIWQHHEQAVTAIWQDIRRKLDALQLDYGKVRIYQDGLPVCGFELQIVQELAGAGSLNHQLVLHLTRQGATLVGTEDPQLLTREYQMQRQQMGAADPPDSQSPQALCEAAELIEARDRFMADRIAATLQESEIGLLFVGAAHPLAALRASDIQVETLDS